MATLPQRSVKKKPAIQQPGPSPQVVSSQWSGPVPPPSTLHGFEQIIPGSAERILRMAEMEQAHRHNGDAHMLEADKSVIQRGHWLGFATTIAAIIAASATALMGAHWAVSVAMVSLPVTAIVKELINRKR